ncbi:extensin-like isoform X2 [Gouania willdenowi]|uniref:extensin-like isoform X2 n=1 Tax=Gouania willdenowi TaxID=441366 RepID=UPI0010561494|nr:extensin-like isoform X2 [Gouania willdenowi]
MDTQRTASSENGHLGGGRLRQISTHLQGYQFSLPPALMPCAASIHNVGYSASAQQLQSPHQQTESPVKDDQLHTALGRNSCPPVVGAVDGSCHSQNLTESIFSVDSSGPPTPYGPAYSELRSSIQLQVSSSNIDLSNAIWSSMAPAPHNDKHKPSTDESSGNTGHQPRKPTNVYSPNQPPPSCVSTAHSNMPAVIQIQYQPVPATLAYQTYQPPPAALPPTPQPPPVVLPPTYLPQAAQYVTHQSPAAAVHQPLSPQPAHYLPVYQLSYPPQLLHQSQPPLQTQPVYQLVSQPPAPAIHQPAQV